MGDHQLGARDRVADGRGIARRKRRPLWAAVGAVLVAGVLGLAGAPSALAIDVFRVPEELRVHPVTPTLDAQHQPTDTEISSSGLTSTQQPDYGSSAAVGNPIRDTLNADANAAGTEVDNKAAALEPNDTAGQDVLRKCLQNALWDILFDAAWDLANGANFDLGSELNTTGDRMTGCVAAKFHVGPVVAHSVSGWMMQSVIDHGADVIAHDPRLAAFINWAAVTAWYSI